MPKGAPKGRKPQPARYLLPWRLIAGDPEAHSRLHADSRDGGLRSDANRLASPEKIASPAVTARPTYG